MVFILDVVYNWDWWPRPSLCIPVYSLCQADSYWWFIIFRWLRLLSKCIQNGFTQPNGPSTARSPSCVMTLRKQQIITKNLNRIFRNFGQTHCSHWNYVLRLRIKRKKNNNNGLFNIHNKNQPITTSFLKVRNYYWPQRPLAFNVASAIVLGLAVWLVILGVGCEAITINPPVFSLSQRSGRRKQVGLLREEDLFMFAIFLSAVQHARKARPALRVTASRKSQRNSDAWSQMHTRCAAARVSRPAFAKAA